MKNSVSNINNLSEHELKEISSRITHLRNDILHMTQLEFCTVLDMSQTYLSMLESGKKQIQKNTIDKILITFRVNIEWLLYGVGSDEDIFLSDVITKDYLTQSSQSEVLADLKRVFQLKDRDIQFLKWYLSLPTSARTSFHSIIDKIKDFITSYPPGNL
ncbi:MAG: helix-turn-helix transcriptional regulator [Lachnospiraceae bacterium]|nr:helix-turn-helix transcriptional regulator [Lachnospiraceae bacterium]